MIHLLEKHLVGPEVVCGHCQKTRELQVIFSSKLNIQMVCGSFKMIDCLFDRLKERVLSDVMLVCFC